MRRQLVARAARHASACIRALLAQVPELADQAVDLLLLPEDRPVQLIQQGRSPMPTRERKLKERQ